jgi:integrase
VRLEPIAELDIRNAKGGKDRRVQFLDPLEGRLRLWFKREELRPNDYLWPIRPGGYYVQRRSPMGNTSFQKWYGDCIQAAGVEYRNPHVTRHTFATRWLRRGGTLETLSRIMGHASIKTTFDLYAHLDTSDVLRDLRVIEGGGK